VPFTLTVLPAAFEQPQPAISSQVTKQYASVVPKLPVFPPLITVQVEPGPSATLLVPPSSNMKESTSPLSAATSIGASTTTAGASSPTAASAMTPPSSLSADASVSAFSPPAFVQFPWVQLLPDGAINPDTGHSFEQDGSSDTG